MIERYGVYWVRLDPTTGSEMSKTRPVVIVSDNLMNQYLHTVVVCPLTTRIHERWPSRISAVIGDQESEIAVDQIRSIAKSRIGDKIGAIDSTTARQVRHIITVMYGLLSVSA